MKVCKAHIFSIIFILLAALFCVAPFTIVHAAQLKHAQTTKQKIVVSTKKKKVFKAPPPPVKAVQPKIAAQLLISSASDVKLVPGENVTVRFGFKNTGKLSWKSHTIQLQGADGALFASSTWTSTSTPLQLNTDELKPGRLEFYDIALHAPNDPGAYIFKAAVVVDGQIIPGGAVTLPIEVLIAESSVIVSQQLLPEPRIRVALSKVEGPVSVRVSAGQYAINLLDGTLVATADVGAKFLLQYEPTAHYYILTNNGTVTTSTQPFRVLAANADCRLVLTDGADVPTWNKKITYNEYRDTFELRWSDKIPGAWMINELPMEEYLKGLIETGSGEPYELQKAVYTAARTYAYIFLPDAAHAAARTWDVHSVWDQVYKGYSAELSNPAGVRAVDETRGVLVTYQRRPVVTPYFTRSDGMTRGWKAVWGGQDKSWLQPVVAKYDLGKKMWGHGVGMSTLDAKARVQQDGWTFEQVLTYYYTGVQLQKVYE